MKNSYTITLVAGSYATVLVNGVPMMLPTTVRRGDEIAVRIGKKRGHTRAELARDRRTRKKLRWADQRLRRRMQRDDEYVRRGGLWPLWKRS
jgi:hypothetical protein